MPLYDQQPTTMDHTSLRSSLPQQLDGDFALPPALSREQCGHIMHIHNLASHIYGDWAFMGTQEPGQEYDVAFRYQLAHMTYAIGATHYHRLPALRSVLKPLMEKLIKKMLQGAEKALGRPGMQREHYGKNPLSVKCRTNSLRLIFFG